MLITNLTNETINLNKINLIVALSENGCDCTFHDNLKYDAVSFYHISFLTTVVKIAFDELVPGWAIESTGCHRIPSRCLFLASVGCQWLLRPAGFPMRVIMHAQNG